MTEILTNSGPEEVIAEAAQGFRNATKRGEISPEEANKRFNEAARMLNILCLAYPDAPFETGSTQLNDLIEEAQRLKTKN